MKKLIYLAIFPMLFSCGMSTEEKLIADYEQTIFESKIDLKFDPIETKLLRVITPIDSAEIIKGWYDSLAKKNKETLSKYFDMYIEQADRYADQAALAKGDLRELILKSNTEYVNKADSILNLMDQIDNDVSFGVPDFLKLKVKEFEEMNQNTLAEVWECRFKIFNPIIQLEQELTKSYLISPDKTKIIRPL